MGSTYGAYHCAMTTLALPQLGSGVTRRRTMDRYGRSIGYLRLSLTRGCAMRCVYCRPGFDRNPVGEERLTPSEIEAVVRHLVEHYGLRKVRLTGGDPTSRPELIDIIQRVAAAGVSELCMTTNGLTLARRAERYAAAGLRRVNVSLDSLDRDTFAALTGVDGLRAVLAGLDAADRAGLVVKLNTVVVRGHNEADLPGLLRFAAGRGWPLRLIELMPMGPLADRWEERYVDEAGMRRALAPVVARYEALEQGRAAARPYRVWLRGGGVGEVGFITPMSCNFCGDCDRLRLDAGGGVYPCLMDEPRGSVLGAVRPYGTREGEGCLDAEAFDEVIAAAYRAKAEVHPAVGFGTMTHIGG